MTERLREALIRAGLTLLLSVGLTLALAGVLRLPASAWVTGGVCAALLSAGLGAATLLPRGAWIGAGAAAALGGLWLLAGGAEQASQVLRAVTLTAQGLGGAMAYAAGPAALMAAFLITLLSFALTGAQMGCFSVCAVMAGLIALWLGRRPDLIPLMIPSGAAALTLLAREHAETTPVRRSLPVLLAVTLLATLLVPGEGITVPPLKQAADDLRQTIMDYFFFTEPRNVFTLASEGYYPQGPDQMGGPAAPSDRAVMTVETPRTAYLRGAVLNEYNGRGWIDSTGGRRYLWVSARWRAQRAEAFDEELPAGTELPAQTLRVTMADGSASSLFVPQRVRSLSVSGSLVPYFNIGSELFATRDLEAEDAYTVTAPLQTAGDEGLAELLNDCARRGDSGRDAAVARLYTVLPAHLIEIEPWVPELAAEIASGASTPYGKALAIRDWLKTHGRYTLDTEPQNPQHDFVASFLRPAREGKPVEGYCVYFASAMTVMCRAVGLPARYVEGYVARPDENGIAQVTGLNGHAWVEVWFSGYGWLTFDPTPSADDPGGAGAPPPASPPPDGAEDPAPTPTPPPAAPAPTPTPEPEETPPEEDEPPEPDEPPEDEPDAAEDPEPPSDRWKWLPAILALLLLIALIVLRFLRTDPARCAARETEEAARWQVWMQAVYDALLCLGERRPRDQTLAQWLAAVDAKKIAPVELWPLGACAGVVFYGGSEPLPEETEQARGIFRALYASMKPGKRIRFRAARAFGRKKAFTA